MVLKDPEQEPITPAAVLTEKQPVAKEAAEARPIVSEPVVHEPEKPESTRPVKMVQLCEVEHSPSSGEYRRL